MNEQLWQQLLDAGEVLVYREQVMSEIDRMYAEIEDNNNAIEVARKKTKLMPKYFIPLMILSVVILYYGIPMFIASLAMPIIGIITMEVSDVIISAISGIILSIISLVIISIGITILVVTIVWFLMRKKRAKHKYKRIKADNEKMNSEITEVIEKLKEDAISYLEGNIYKIEFLPVDYQTADAAGFMLQAVKNLRADSLKEAINLYAEELKHRESMAAAERQRIQNEEMMYAMQMLNMNMENMTSSQERTNRTLNDINFIQTMDFLSRN